MEKRKFTLAVLLVIIFLYGCNITESREDKIHYLTSKKWVLQKVTEKQNEISFVRFKKTNSAKNKTNDFNNIKLSFLKDGTFEIINWDNQKDTGSWIYDYKNNLILVHIFRKNKVDNDTLFIEKLNEKNFEYRQIDRTSDALSKYIPE